MTSAENRHIPIPIGTEMLKTLRSMASATEGQSQDLLQQTDQQTHVMIGTALSALYQAATCHRKCYQGPHVLEALCGRAFNLGSSAYLLARFGFYDEAMNLIRGIGEIGNLISLSIVDNDAFRIWLKSDTQARLREFTPAKIRNLVGAKGGVQIANSDWYSQLCESYTHVTPETKPNMHNPAGQGFVGGAFQPEGLHRTLRELGTVLSTTAMFVSAYAKFDDILAEFYSFADSLREKRDESHKQVHNPIVSNGGTITS
jgi:hypothetical protein